MAQFRAKKLDLGCFINSKIIRDHTKRKTFEQFEPQRYTPAHDIQSLYTNTELNNLGKLFGTSSVTPPSRTGYEQRHNSS
ncbi:uncharacterized protein Z519_10835 [Cladophialophora bantiana CBS 173.52]|uniref:Uncharacterized protein n=1 Tax=Cladophialophora bantiana (strain ATCC 10958 / CBS 173.52 / CDC B-1940 / NIH 8579) TaxID=1442370 RepID=A0A0D2H635_CLAB1|nr:uncharacterized protein Z519_10835 [Cladophialophora bantiana CBS 173.52]KIW88788.1 hypothetical protein Z519_10835 [Cladophialophora bantiana CBS 173.52]